MEEETVGKCFDCDLSLVKQILHNDGTVLTKEETEEYKKWEEKERSYQDCMSCKRFIRVYSKKPRKARLCSDCGGTYKPQGEKTRQNYDALMRKRKFGWKIWSCPVHGTVPYDREREIKNKGKCKRRYGKGTGTQGRSFKESDEYYDFLQSLDLNGWQKGLFKKLQEKYDGYTLKWYVDLKGKTGKSTFVDWYKFHHGCLSFLSVGKIYHSGAIVESALRNKQWDGRVILIDLSNKCDDDMYTTIEWMLDGWVPNLESIGPPFSEISGYFFERPHVVVFSNFIPDINQLSEPRWKITDISKSRPN